MTKKFDIKKLLIARIRQISRWDPIKREVLKDASVGASRIKCATCKKIYPVRFIDVDHIEPVVLLDGSNKPEADYETKTFKNWDTYLSRMFCPKEGRQALCEECHDKKTASERTKRTSHRKNQRAKEPTKARRKCKRSK